MMCGGYLKNKFGNKVETGNILLDEAENMQLGTEPNYGLRF